MTASPLDRLRAAGLTVEATPFGLRVHPRAKLTGELMEMLRGRGDEIRGTLLREAAREELDLAPTDHATGRPDLSVEEPAAEDQVCRLRQLAQHPAFGEKRDQVLEIVEKAVTGGLTEAGAYHLIGKLGDRIAEGSSDAPTASRLAGGRCRACGRTIGPTSSLCGRCKTERAREGWARSPGRSRTRRIASWTTSSWRPPGATRAGSVEGSGSADSARRSSRRSSAGPGPGSSPPTRRPPEPSAAGCRRLQTGQEGRVNREGDRIALTKDELLEVLHRYLEADGYTDPLGGMEWARRIEGHGGAAAYREHALAVLEESLQEVEFREGPPATSLERLEETRRRRYGLVR